MRERIVSILIVGLLFGAGFLSLGFLDLQGPLGDAEALDITGLTVINTNTNYGEDIYIKNGGTLRIMSGVSVGMAVGTNIYVEGGGTLEILGQPNNKAWVQTSSSGYWGGIVAYGDAVILIRWADIRFADYGLQLDGTGHSTSSGAVSVNNTSFTTCTYGIYADGDGNSAPFNFRFWDNYINNPDYGIYIENGYNGITLENNDINNAHEYGFYLAGLGNVKVWNNSVTNSHRAMLMGGTVTENFVENNTIRDCYWGIYGAFLGNAKFRNNSIFTKSKSIYMPIAADLLIENNTITSTGNGWNPPLDVYDNSGLTTIKNNIISGCGELIYANGSSPVYFDIYDNLLLNLTELKYVDSMGDGFVDVRVPCPGSAGAFAYSCRTSVFYVNQPGIVESYVTPKQASEHARVGSTLKMISNPVGYGPKDLEDRHIYHTQLPIINWPMNFTGEESEYLVFNPGACMNSATIQNTEHAGLSNFTVRSGPYTVYVESSNDIELSNIYSNTHEYEFQSGFYIYECEDVKLTNCYASQSYVYGMHIEKSTRVTIKDSRILGADTYGAYILNSVGVKADNTSLTFMDNYGIYGDHSQISWKGSDIRSKVLCLYLIDSDNCEFKDLSFNTVNNADRTVIVEDSKGTHFTDCNFNIGFKLVDSYALYLRNDARRTVVENCSFTGDPGNTNTLAGIYTVANITGSQFNNSTFSYMSGGIAITPIMGNIFDVQISGGLFAQNDMGIVVSYFGDLSIDDIDIRQGSIGIYGVTTKLECRDMNIYQMETGLIMIRSEFTVMDSYINAALESFNCTDTMDSMVINSDLHGIPVSMNLGTGTESHIWFDNCTGDESASKILAEGCYANWTWPLQVNVYDEIGDLQPCHLSVSSPTFGEVLNKSIDGSEYLEDLLGWWTDYSGHHDVSDYTVRVMDPENYQTDNPTMLSYQITEFIFNHAPTISTSAPTEINFNEDEVWTDDISDWFNDRDSLTYELDEVLGENLSGSLDGTTLTLSNSGDDLYGEGRIIIQVWDTFGEYVELDIDVIIEPVNDPPLAESPIELNISEDGSKWLNLTSYASDVDTKDLSWSNGTAENFTIEWTSSMNFTISPDPNWFGTQNITFIVTDGEHLVETTLVVNVEPVNDAPVWNGDPVYELTLDAGDQEIIDISGLYEDVDSEEITITSDDENALIADDIITVSYPASTSNMTETITVTISDGDLSTTFLLDITVVEIPEGSEEWEIIEGEVTIDPETGEWKVNVSGGEDQDIYIVIDGVGSYKLEETSPGEYSVTIPGSDFEEGSSYDYHFSDTDGGDDKTGGSFGGTMQQPTVSVDDDDTDDDDDDDDDDSSEKDEGIPIWIILLGIIILILIIVIAFMLLSGKKEEDYYDEE